MIPTITPRELAKYIPENSSTQRTLILRPKDQKTSLVGTLELLELRRGLGRFVLIPASIGILNGVGGVPAPHDDEAGVQEVIPGVAGVKGAIGGYGSKTAALI